MSAVRNSGKLLSNMLADINDALEQLDKAHQFANPDPRTAELLIRDAQRHLERMKSRMPQLQRYLDIADERSSAQQQGELEERVTALESDLTRLHQTVQALTDHRVVSINRKETG